MRKNSVTSSFILCKWISGHIEISILVILSKAGEKEPLGFVTQSTPEIPVNLFRQPNPRWLRCEQEFRLQ